MLHQYVGRLLQANWPCHLATHPIPEPATKKSSSNKDKKSQVNMCRIHINTAGRSAALTQEDALQMHVYRKSKHAWVWLSRACSGSQDFECGTDSTEPSSTTCRGPNSQKRWLLLHRRSTLALSSHRCRSIVEHWPVVVQTSKPANTSVFALDQCIANQ